MLEILSQIYYLNNNNLSEKGIQQGMWLSEIHLKIVLFVFCLEKEMSFQCHNFLNEIIFGFF